MKQTINFSQFCDEFQSIRPDNFSYDGLRALFDYLEAYGEDTGEEVELDVIAICCDFTEYENLAEFQENYGDGYETLEDIEQNTVVLPLNGEGYILDTDGFIIHDF